MYNAVLAVASRRSMARAVLRKAQPGYNSSSVASTGTAATRQSLTKTPTRSVVVVHQEEMADKGSSQLDWQCMEVLKFI